MPTLAVATIACVSSPRDWAVSKSSHMQQDMGISFSPPRPGAPFPLFVTIQVGKPIVKKLRERPLRNSCHLCEYCNESFPLRRTPVAQKHAHSKKLFLVVHSVYMEKSHLFNFPREESAYSETAYFNQFTLVNHLACGQWQCTCNEPSNEFQHIRRCKCNNLF